MKKIIFIMFFSIFCYVGYTKADDSVKFVLNSLQCNGVDPVTFDISNNEIIDTYKGKKIALKYKVLQDTPDLFVIQMEKYNKELQNGPDEITYERKPDGKIYRTLKSKSSWSNATTEEPRECWKKK